MNFLFVAIFSFILSFVAFKLALNYFPRFGLLDRPDRYGLFRKPIPYPGGIVIFLIFLILTLFFVPFDKRLLGVILGASLLTAVSFYDDHYNVSALFRLFIQAVSVVLVIIFGVGIEGIANPFGGFVPLNEFKNSFNLFGFQIEFVWLADIAILFWILIMINTMNWLDGLHGLASGVSGIGFFVLFLLSVILDHTIDQTQVSYLSLILAIISFTFLLFNFPPAKILLGDSGSMFFGFMLAVLSILAGAKLATTFLIMAIPIFDLMWVVGRRVFFEKRSPTRGDLKHFHHRLLKAGFSERKAVLLIYCVCALAGGFALFLNSFTKMVAIVALFVFMFLLGVWVVRRSSS